MKSTDKPFDPQTKAKERKKAEKIMAEFAKQYCDNLWASRSPEEQAIRPIVQAYIDAFFKTYRYYPKCDLLRNGRISFYGNILPISELPRMTQDLLNGVDSWKIYNAKGKFIGIIESNYPSAYAHWSKKKGFKIVPYNDNHLQYPFEG